eukprot:Gb_40329 [translate_table: standard]
MYELFLHKSSTTDVFELYFYLGIGILDCEQSWQDDLSALPLKLPIGSGQPVLMLRVSYMKTLPPLYIILHRHNVQRTYFDERGEPNGLWPGALSQASMATMQSPEQSPNSTYLLAAALVGVVVPLFLFTRCSNFTNLMYFAIAVCSLCASLFGREEVRITDESREQQL